MKPSGIWKTGTADVKGGGWSGYWTWTGTQWNWSWVWSNPSSAGWLPSVGSFTVVKPLE